MSVFAAVMTGQGTGAISTIQLFGPSAEGILKKIFKPAAPKPSALQLGSISLGTIKDGEKTIDQVTIGCESEENFAIHCHGNPLIVEMIMQLLQKHAARLLSPQELLIKILSKQKDTNAITIEAKLTQADARTIEGTKIIANQIKGGLNRKAKAWLEKINSVSLSKIAAEADKILEKSQTAKLIIFGCKTAIIGPPNSGKSTLLNCLAGRQKAIVTDIKGTTRDWVSANCRIGPLYLELFDTAGLDEETAAATAAAIERKAQQKSIKILEQADLVLPVLDSSRKIEQLNEKTLAKIGSKPVLTVLNKSDLASRLNIRELPEILKNTARISAKLGTGIENLTEKIQQTCGVTNFDLQSPVCITARQEKLLKKLNKAKSRQQALSVITELLNGKVNV